MMVARTSRTGSADDAGAEDLPPRSADVNAGARPGCTSAHLAQLAVPELAGKARLAGVDTAAVNDDSVGIETEAARLLPDAVMTVERTSRAGSDCASAEDLLRRGADTNASARRSSRPGGVSPRPAQLAAPKLADKEAALVAAPPAEPVLAPETATDAEDAEDAEAAPLTAGEARAEHPAVQASQRTRAAEAEPAQEAWKEALVATEAQARGKMPVALTGPEATEGTEAVASWGFLELSAEEAADPATSTASWAARFLVREAVWRITTLAVERNS